MKRQTLSQTARVKRSRGFTLVEATVIIFIVVILASLISPRIPAFEKSRQVQTFIDGLPRIVTQARINALTSGKTTKITYDQAQKKLVVGQEQTDQGDKTIASLPVPDAVRLASFQLGGQPSGPSDWILNFYADGKCDGGGIEVNDANRLRGLQVSTNGLGRLIDGPLPVAGEDTWSAGELVQRGN